MSIPKILTTQVDANIIKFRSITNTNFYGIYDPKRTTLKRVIDTLFDNYSCDGIARETINIYSDELDKSLYDLNSNRLMDDLGFSKMTSFTMKYEPYGLRK